MKTNSFITKSFNAGLFLYLFYTWLLILFNEPSGKSRPSMWDRIGEWSPTLELLLAVVCWLILIFWGAWVLKEFWKRFLVDVFSVRAINNDEALAIVLVFAILTI